MTWARSGNFIGDWTSENGYWGSRQILKKLRKRDSQLADILVVEKNGYDTKKYRTYRDAGKIIIPAEKVFEYFVENHPELLL